MELRQLQYFVTVARHGSFTRAAELLHLSQPGVSAQIRQLEKELGHPLLDRSGRGVRLTRVGEAVLPHAQAALASAAAARQTALEFGGPRRGHVRLGLVAGAGLGVPPREAGVDQLPGLATTLAAFRQEHPGIDISLSEDVTTRMLDELRAGRLDLALIGLPTAASGREGDDGWNALAGLAVHTVLEVPLVAAFAGDHPLALGPDGALPVAALAGHALLSTPRGTGLRTALERALAEAAGGEAAVGGEAGAGTKAAGTTAGADPRSDPAVAVEAAAPPQLAELAAHGLGVAIVPDPPSVPGLRVRPLTDPVPLVRIALAWPAGEPTAPPTAALLAHLRGTYPGPRQGA
ncbi:LysR family transcriptional regulator [Kitasatospora sp. NPDC097643]|uniref:LysR family transcriptional regulator n=1 Tax=Kitasatospora sp. NPDC097643 TaxID=3157230 RepID=UPI0033289E70